MIFSCQTKDLVSAVMTSIRCLAARTPMEILEKVYLDADEKGLTIAAADGAMASFTTIPATIVTDGVCLLPGRLLSEVARKLPEGEVKCSLSDKYVMTLTAGPVRINLSAMPADEYPLPAEEGYESSLSLPQPLLKDMISKVAFTVPQEDQRLILTGGFLNIARGRADLVGLDGYRMAMRSELISDTELAAKAVIPVRALEEIAKLMGDDEEKSALISFNKSSVKVENGETVLYANLLNGEYIDYNRVIPKTSAIKAEIDMAEFAACVDRAQMIARLSRNNLVKIEVEDGRLILSAQSEQGDVTDELPAVTDASGLTIHFNVRYLSEIARVMNKGRALMSFGTATSPCVITPVEGSEFLFLVLPVRTNT